jgi:hypothetical protein
VFQLKCDENGKVVKFKARIVAKGFSQTPGVDYDDIYSPVLKKKSVRILIALAVENEWVINHLDVNSAYLKSPIHDEVYVEQPEGYLEQGKCSKGFVCKLKRA